MYIGIRSAPLLTASTSLVICGYAMNGLFQFLQFAGWEKTEAGAWTLGLPLVFMFVGGLCSFVAISDAFTEAGNRPVQVRHLIDAAAFGGLLAGALAIIIVGAAYLLFTASKIPFDAVRTSIAFAAAFGILTCAAGAWMFGLAERLTKELQNGRGICRLMFFWSSIPVVMLTFRGWWVPALVVAAAQTVLLLVINVDVRREQCCNKTASSGA